MAKSSKKSKVSRKSLLTKLRESESGASIVFGAIVVVVVGVLLFNYTSSNRKALLSEKGETTEVTELSGTSVSLPSTYTVVQGDNLWRIAEKFYGSGYNWVDIAAANKLHDADKLRTGMFLSIPAAEPINPAPVSRDVLVSAYIPPQPIVGNSYLVMPNDSLWSIALRAYGDGYKWTSIYQANKQLIANPEILYAGWTLSLPR